jgi:hypothetical protein
MFKFHVEPGGGDAVPTVTVNEETDEGYVTLKNNPKAKGD